MARPVFWLINPWIHDFAAFNFWSRPLGLLRVAEALSAYDADLAWIDCLPTFHAQRFHTGKYCRTRLATPEALRGMPRQYSRYGLLPEQVENLLRGLPAPDAILITTIMTYWYPGAAEAVALCRRLHPQTPVIVGGIYCRLFPDHARRHLGADYIFSGAVDQGFAPFLESLGLGLHPVRPPQPYHRLGLFPAGEFAPLLTSEGCPFRCSYCASRRLFPRFSQRPAAEVAAEIADLAGQGAEDFAFYDDALLANAEAHLQPILQAVLGLKKPLRFHTPNGLHARYVNLPLARLMKKAGFKTLRLGLETTSPHRQAATGGKVDNDAMLSAVDHLRTAGFASHELGAYLMYGLPGQGLDEVRAGVQWLMAANLRIHLTEFSPLPGTPAWDECVRRGLMPADIDPVLTNNTVFALRFGGIPPAEIKKLKDQVAIYNGSL